MAGSAVLWGRLIEQNGLLSDLPRQLMAFHAAHILVRPAQREGSLLVIKQ